MFLNANWPLPVLDCAWPRKQWFTTAYGDGIATTAAMLSDERWLLLG